MSELDWWWSPHPAWEPAELPIERLIIPHGAVVEPDGAAGLRVAVAESRRG